MSLPARPTPDVSSVPAASPTDLLPTIPPEDDVAYDPRNLRKAAASTLIGTILEQYDMILFGSAVAVIFNVMFFPSEGPAAGLIAAFASYGVGFLARPLGGLFFSHFGEKHGRKWILVATLFLMGTATFLIGILPTYAAVGVISPILLVILRLAQGFGAGAEQTGGMTLLAETSRRSRRGRNAALVAVGSGVGIILGGGVWSLVQQLMTPEAFLEWGWRLTFLSSVLVTITAYIVRRTLNESPVYMEAKAQRKVEKAPIIEVWRSGKRPLFTVFGMAFGTMANGYVFLTFMAAYLINYQGISAAVVANIVVAGAVATSISPYVFGWLTDHFGRRRVNLVLASILVVYPPFAFMLASSGDLTLVYIGVVGGFALVVTGMNGSYGAYFPELFGSGFRVTGVTLGRELASMIAGGFTPLIATALIAASGGSWIPIAVLMCGTAIVTLVSTALAPETRGRDLVTDEDAFAERQRTR
ncbi:MFS transporter [Microbacterium sp. 10M-3C3]|jgi:MFS family permease|uniref:MFS transporter n=1 Tax=Microbacterium sp. 10M-3C3 TaxID=2483401 RepID=UPI000F633567|nr:MFS transporter [Microbacterium sp. 10M-3C3]